MRLAELFDTVDAVLRGSGYRVERIRYPDEHRRRSIDVIAVRDGSELLLKIVEDVADLSVSDIRELHACSEVLRSRGLIVAEKDMGDEIDYMVAHERGGTYAVSIEGLKSALRGSIYVIKKQNNYYMRVDGAKLKEKRIEKGYSLGDVASRLSVSRRSVYLYEQGETLVSLSVALKLMDMFGDEIFKPFDIVASEGDEEGRQRASRVYASLSQSSSRTQVARLLASLGFDVATTRRIPPDIVAGSSEHGARIMVVVEKRRDTKLERRVEEAARVAEHLRAEMIAVTREKKLEGYGAAVVPTLEELRRILEEKLGKARDTGNPEPGT